MHLGFSLSNLIPTKPHTNLSQSLIYAYMQQANPILRWKFTSDYDLSWIQNTELDHYMTTLRNIMTMITSYIFSLPMQYNLLPNFIYHIIREIYFLEVLDGIRCISFHSNLMCRSECFYFMSGPAKIPINSVTSLILIKYVLNHHITI
jgi:hypothetical protein